MIYLGNIIAGLAWIIGSILNIYLIIVIISALISWVNPDPYNPIVQFLRNVTEPIYIYIRKYLPFVYIGGIDLSPIVLILLIEFVDFAIVSNLKVFANQLIQTSMATGQYNIPR